MAEASRRASDDQLLNCARAIQARRSGDLEERGQRIDGKFRATLREQLGREPTDDEVREAKDFSLEMFMAPYDDGTRETLDVTAETLARLLAAMRQAEVEATKPPAEAEESAGD